MSAVVNISSSENKPTVKPKLNAIEEEIALAKELGYGVEE